MKQVRVESYELLFFAVLLPLVLSSRFVMRERCQKTVTMT